MSEKLEKLQENLDKAIEKYEGDLKSIRTGRANPTVVEDLVIDYFGVSTPINQAANVTSTDARTIVIAPWSKDSLVDIEKAINESELGISPVNDGEVVRLSFPPLTEERRRELVKVVGQKTEEARIRIRKLREGVRDDISREEKDGNISEDDKFRENDALQKIIDDYNKQIDILHDKKETDLMNV
jgi:ribosome recycling factor